jgi:hypothetical protein
MLTIVSHSIQTEAALSPVPVTKLVCDGDSYKCTASLVSISLNNAGRNIHLFFLRELRTTAMVTGSLSGPHLSSTPVSSVLLERLTW